MSTELKIDFVSDIACPWCAVGLNTLEAALAQLPQGVTASVHFQPFELNPQMPDAGQDTAEHLTQKYGSTPAQQAQIREVIRQRGAEVGFVFRAQGRDRIYNTFDAHRLLHWAGLEGGTYQHTLKKALLRAYFTEGENPASHAVLIRLASEVGLDGKRAGEILASDEFAGEVREAEARYQSAGIHSVPAIIINDRHLISGAQPLSVFVQALSQIAESVNPAQ